MNAAPILRASFLADSPGKWNDCIKVRNMGEADRPADHFAAGEACCVFKRLSQD